MADQDDDGPDTSRDKPTRLGKPTLPLPSDNPTTNLLIADIVVRGASSLFRKDVKRRVAKASVNDPQEARELADGRSILTTLGLYGASKLATRSVPGLLAVTGGLIVKTLYDRGKAVRRRKAIEQSQEEGEG